MEVDKNGLHLHYFDKFALYQNIFVKQKFYDPKSVVIWSFMALKEISEVEGVNTNVVHHLT